MSRLDDIRGLRIQPGFRSRRFERTARRKVHRVLFNRLPRHRALQFGAGRAVIDSRSDGLVGERVVIVPQRLVLRARPRNEIGNASELRMAATQSGDARGGEQTSVEHCHTWNFLKSKSFGFSFFETQSSRRWFSVNSASPPRPLRFKSNSNRKTANRRLCFPRSFRRVG